MRTRKPTLKQWLDRNDRPAAWLAGRIGVSRQTLWNWMNEIYIPRADKLEAIRRETKGQVTTLEQLTGKARWPAA